MTSTDKIPLRIDLQYYKVGLLFSHLAMLLIKPSARQSQLKPAPANILAPPGTDTFAFAQMQAYIPQPVYETRLTSKAAKQPRQSSARNRRIEHHASLTNHYSSQPERCLSSTPKVLADATSTPGLQSATVASIGAGTCAGLIPSTGGSSADDMWLSSREAELWGKAYDRDWSEGRIEAWGWEGEAESLGDRRMTIVRL